MKALIFLFNGEINNFNFDEYDYIIGCDRGAYILASNKINMDLALGDFDSINDNEFELLKKYSKKIIKLNPIKDDSDTSHAISLVKDYDEIIINGGIKGNRIEHFYANLIELINNKKIKMVDSNSLIETINDDNYIFNLNYKYVSLFSLLDESIVSLYGFKYNLDNYKMKRFDPLGLSNEIIDNPKIKLKGRLLIIYSKNDHIN